MGNLEHRYVYSSLYAYIQAIFYFPYLELKLLHIPVFLIYVSLVAYLIEKIENTYEASLQTFLGFLTIFLILKFTRLSEFGYDYINHFLLIFLFTEFIISRKISLATIYNTVHAFQKRGYIKKIPLDANKSYYDTNVKDHHHFFDEDSQTLKDIDQDKIKISTIPQSPIRKKIKSIWIII